MNTPTLQVSPVNMEERAQLGIKPGDTVRVWIKVQERGKVRLQSFEGLVLAQKHGTEAGATFTVRKVASGVGVEKIFPLYSPSIDRIEIIRRAKVRRSKLYYIREKAARQIRRQMRNMQLVSISTESDIAQKEAAEKAAQEVEEAAQAAEAVAAEEQQPEATEAPAEEVKDEASTEESTDEPKEAAAAADEEEKKE